MHRNHHFIVLAAALYALAPGGSVLAASRPQTPPPQTPLLRARVDGTADQDIRFVSFLPTNRHDLVWADGTRQQAWKTRVAGKIGLQAENVDVRPYSSPFRIVAAEHELECLLERGMKGKKKRSTTLDSGETVSRDNQFEVISASETAVEVVWVKQPATFRLRCDQGTGDDMWFVTGEELEAHWTQMCAKGKGAVVRREVNLVLDALDRGSASLCRGRPEDRAAWKDWLFSFKEQTPATWPSIVFENSYVGLDGRPGPIVVTCGGETSPEIPPGGTWTKTWEN